MRWNDIKPLEKDTLEFHNVGPEDHVSLVIRNAQESERQFSILREFVKQQTNREAVRVESWEKTYYEETYDIKIEYTY